ncbi:YafY family protein [Saccharibacillus sp. CPCC 101409]|uniref:helix-turn-helix transcriptional regulator n=1 Tax=Saccharibacillus sp. CPCC 101409 TaxID=3058041 RepID=UPI002670E8C5|nr:YafY family protein [Saccharibacillus sp. CPCC 101409]MDO3411744.1 YafY family protein [Saccharibacillus sp. CPCC 101409]
MKLERMIAIVYKLLNHEVLSASTLAEEYGVSQRTVYRDIDALCAAGFPIVSYQGQSGGYGIMEGYKMDKSLLGSYDVESLVTVLRGLSTVFEDDRAQGTIERLQTVEPNRQGPSVSVAFETRSVEPEALPKLRTGIAQRQVVRFDYVNAGNERLERELEPLRLEFKYRNWYVYGFCRIRGDYREFRLSRMFRVELTSETFVPRGDAPPDVSDPKAPLPLSEVVIRVRPEALAEALDHFQQADKQFHPDGGMTLRIEVPGPLDAGWLRAILLGFGSGAEVLHPPELRRLLKNQLREMLVLYENEEK